jgi:hypothetical protein
LNPVTGADLTDSLLSTPKTSSLTQPISLQIGLANQTPKLGFSFKVLYIM